MSNARPSQTKRKQASFEPFESRTINSKYVRITLDMAKSSAWKALTTQARLLYITIKLHKYNARPGSARDISFTYTEAKELLGYAERTFTGARDLLIETGFLDLVEHWPHSSNKPNIYGLSDRWHSYGKDHFVARSRPKRRGADHNIQAV